MAVLLLFYILRIFVVYCLSLCFRSPVLQFFQNPPNFFCQNLLTTAVLVAIIQYVVRRQQHIWGFSSAGRALAWHARGHRFDPGNLHQKEKHCTGMCGAFLLCLPSYAAAKFMLDICGKLWYNSFCNCGYSTSASISAFQAEEVGSIPITRSKRPEP